LLLELYYIRLAGSARRGRVKRFYRLLPLHDYKLLTVGVADDWNIFSFIPSFGL